MLDKETRDRIIALIHKEVVPAIGCTEPMAVALATARAKEALGELPESIEVQLSDARNTNWRCCATLLPNHLPRVSFICSSITSTSNKRKVSPKNYI